MRWLAGPGVEREAVKALAPGFRAIRLSAAARHLGLMPRAAAVRRVGAEAEAVAEAAMAAMAAAKAEAEAEIEALRQQLKAKKRGRAGEEGEDEDDEEGQHAPKRRASSRRFS